MLFPCPLCKRYIRDDEALCPFCNEAVTSGPAELADNRGLSRRDMFALATVAVVASACEDKKPELEPDKRPAPQPKSKPTASASAKATSSAAPKASASAAPSAKTSATPSATAKASAKAAAPKPRPVPVAPPKKVKVPIPAKPYGCVWADPDDTVEV